MIRPTLQHVLLPVIIAVTAPVQALTYDDARHLLHRTGFGATDQQIRVLQPLTRDQAVHQILSKGSGKAQQPPPPWVNDRPLSPKQRKALSAEQRRAYQRKLRQQGRELQIWWWKEIVTTPSPLTEKMTLFWHNHFTSSLRKVKWPPLMYHQNRLLRRHAMGNFGTLLKAVLRDPAMLIYLDNVSNHKRNPNENLARELLELFTLGEGHYTEHDVKAAARALTGRTVNPRTGMFHFAARRHDDGEKAFLGEHGRFDGDDIADLLLQRPETARFIVTKLWREFISLEPDMAEIEHLAERFRRSGYEIKPLLAALLTSEAFWDPQHRAALIKSPVELIAGTLRTLQIHVHEWPPILRISRNLGQALFNPPNVKGWPGGKRWITSATLVQRQALLQRLLRSKDMHRAMMGGKSTTAPTRPAAAVTSRQTLAHLLMPAPPLTAVDGDTPYAWLNALLLDPVYQLK